MCSSDLFPSHDNTNIGSGAAAYTTGNFTLVEATTEQGSRTVSHLNIKMLTDWSGNGSGADDGYVIPFGYTVQYVPSG